MMLTWESLLGMHTHCENLLPSLPHFLFVIGFHMSSVCGVFVCVCTSLLSLLLLASFPTISFPLLHCRPFYLPLLLVPLLFLPLNPSLLISPSPFLSYLLSPIFPLLFSSTPSSTPSYTHTHTSSLSCSHPLPLTHIHTPPPPLQRKPRSVSVAQMRRSTSKFATTTTSSGMPVLENEPVDRARSMAIRDVSNIRWSLIKWNVISFLPHMGVFIHAHVQGWELAKINILHLFVQMYYH